MTDLADRLDEAITRRLAGQHRSEGDLDPLLAGLEAIEPLRAAPRPDAETRAQGRQAFLAQAREVLPSVFGRRERRNFITFPNFKELFVMSRLSRVAVAVLVVVLALSGVSATAFAAQASLPAEPLYGLKLVTEDVRLSLTADPAAEVTLLTELAARRTDEMVRLAAAHRPIPSEVPARLEAHLAQALAVAAGLSVPQPSLEQIRLMVEAQSAALAQARSIAPNDSSLEQAGQHLDRARALTEMGLTDPAQLRGQMSGQSTPPMPTEMPSMGPSSMPTMMPSAMPTMQPTEMPMSTLQPTSMPMPTMQPSAMPMPTMRPTDMPMPTMQPSAMPMPTMQPTDMPMPTMQPSAMPMPTGMPGGGGGGMP
jgi:hypothetical protein